MKYKNQHFVTEAYLRAWCDPKTPKGYEPYVWIVSKKDRIARKKSPKKIFKEADFYTITDSAGNRNVDFEKALQKIESSFMTVRRDKIRHRKPLSGGEMVTIATFIASMFARVKVQREQQTEMWGELLDDMDKASPEVQAQWKENGTYDQVHDLRKQPLPYNIINFTNLAVPFFSRMNCQILETETEPGFIASDNPCFMIDPAISTSPALPTSWIGVFNSPTVEVLFPVSPKQLISLTYTGPNKYTLIDESPEAIDELNKVFVANSEEFIVINQKEFKEAWFENI
jgi:Protein of unknown function (DUF4238)